MDRGETIKEIRSALKRRSGKPWSVRGGGWGWIIITAPPSRLIDGWLLTPEDRAELSQLLGIKDVGPQQELVPYEEWDRYIDMANGRKPSAAPASGWGPC